MPPELDQACIAGDDSAGVVTIGGSADGVVNLVGTESDIELTGSTDATTIDLTGTVDRCGG